MTEQKVVGFWVVRSWNNPLLGMKHFAEMMQENQARYSALMLSPHCSIDTVRRLPLKPKAPTQTPGLVKFSHTAVQLAARNGSALWGRTTAASSPVLGLINTALLNG